MPSLGNVKQVLSKMSGQDAIMAIDDLLSPIFYSEPESLSEEEKVIVYVEELEREVNNGGFSQFFYNLSGNYVEEVVQSLQKIGSVKFLHLLEDAIAKFPNSFVPKDSIERQRILKNIEDEANTVWNSL